MSPRLVILGNSAAALAAVRAIRGLGCPWPVTLVSREACGAYSPVLTTYYLRGQIREEQLYLCDRSFYQENQVDCRLGRSVVELDDSKQTLLLDDGSRLSYDSLLIATGASPRRLGGISPEVAADICYLRTVEDARRIKQKARNATHVVVIGGGLVSLQVATALSRPDLLVTGVVGSRQLLSQNVDAAAAGLVRRHLERRTRMQFVFGASVSSLVRTGSRYRLTLDTGEELAADLVVVGKGVTPNIDFLREGPIQVARGILVDQFLRTGAGNVYAAGDVAEARSRITGCPEPAPNWINACEQGRIAGMNMAGREAAFPGSVPENVTSVLGLPVASVGVTQVPPQKTGIREITWAEEERDLYRRLLFRGERPVGAVLVGGIDDVGVIRSAIAEGSDLGVSPQVAVRQGVGQADRLKACLP